MRFSYASLPKKSSISSSTEPMPAMPKLLTRTFATFGGKEGRERRSEVDVLHAEVEKREEHDDCLLLVPSDVVRQRKLFTSSRPKISFSLSAMTARE